MGKNNALQAAPSVSAQHAKGVISHKHPGYGIGLAF
jgi:hypothetical protein